MILRKFVESLSPLKAGVFAFAFISLVHAAYAFFLAVDVPMWDQWDSEAEWYKRLVAGNIDIQSLIAPHNEHRIAFTRLFNGALFTLAGGWSPVLGVYAQIPLIGLAVALLCAWLVKFAEDRRFVAIALTLLAFSLPFSWGNILNGFQNQFYFMLLFALIAMYLAATAENTTALILAVFLSLVSPFTVAGGIGTIMVLWGLFLLRLFEPSKHRIRYALFLLILSVGLVLHVRLLVHVPGHDSLHAQNLKEFIVSFLKILGWPDIPIGLLAWSAIVLAVFSWLRSAGGFLKGLTLLSGPKRFALGLLAWYVFQAAATAYSRTHSDLMSTRYQQNFALVIPIAFITMGVFGYHLERKKLVRWAYAILVVGLLIRSNKELPYLQRTLENSHFARKAILEAMQKSDFAMLKAQDSDGKVGYFHAERIWEQINSPELRGRHLWLGSSVNK
ncbi:hypothetical protein [Turneriella parva]|uniref:Glycosyltransferase RgtA/B/C/D-like domain-containing protein n=1 Tax=Turneriella parva (strain ATCC BAA-1111 / DSM 21527 / NCTC 11395 / H) TaxID=869212 RepID=I4B106_TURPD|nr:hypothetical protein [Turneriella parva]AFM10963.1 hypothetical protein Turpa_0303 [Turneriella parva DSM 21527]